MVRLSSSSESSAQKAVCAHFPAQTENCLHPRLGPFKLGAFLFELEQHQQRRQRRRRLHSVKSSEMQIYLPSWSARKKRSGLIFLSRVPRGCGADRVRGLVPFFPPSILPWNSGGDAGRRQRPRGREGGEMEWSPPLFIFIPTRIKLRIVRCLFCSLTPFFFCCCWTLFPLTAVGSFVVNAGCRLYCTGSNFNAKCSCLPDFLPPFSFVSEV